jgi:hypothetical protein
VGLAVKLMEVNGGMVGVRAVEQESLGCCVKEGPEVSERLWVSRTGLSMDSLVEGCCDRSPSPVAV